MKRSEDLNMKKYENPEFDQLLNEVVEELRSDPLVAPKIKDMGLTVRQVKEGISILLDYRDDAHVCSSCPGFDRCPKGMPHLKISLDLYEGHLVRHDDFCDLFLEHEKQLRRYLRRDFPYEMLGITRKDLDESIKRNSVLAALYKRVSRKSSDWVYLYGKRNLGKTFIMVFFANLFSDEVARGNVYANTSKLLGELKDDSINQSEIFRKKMKAYENAPLLVLDEFGIEFKSEYVFSQILYPLISERARNEKITCFVSDFDPKAVEEMYAAKIGAAMAKQFFEMIKGNGDVLHLEGAPVY